MCWWGLRENNNRGREYCIWILLPDINKKSLTNNTKESYFHRKLSRWQRCRRKLIKIWMTQVSTNVFSAAAPMIVFYCVGWGELLVIFSHWNWNIDVKYHVEIFSTTYLTNTFLTRLTSSLVCGLGARHAAEQRWRGEASFCFDSLLCGRPETSFKKKLLLIIGKIGYHELFSEYLHSL